MKEKKNEGEMIETKGTMAQVKMQQTGRDELSEVIISSGVYRVP